MNYKKIIDDIERFNTFYLNSAIVFETHLYGFHVQNSLTYSKRKQAKKLAYVGWKLHFFC